MSVLDTVIVIGGVVLVGGIGLFVYKSFGKGGFLSGVGKTIGNLGDITAGGSKVASHVIGEITGAIDKGLSIADLSYDRGVGTPVQLEPCPPGWTNTGLICNEPITCAQGWDFFKYGCRGGNLVGRLNHGGVCPPGKVKDAGLCYVPCKVGFKPFATTCSPLHTDHLDWYAKGGVYKPKSY